MREECGLRVFKNGVLRRIFRPQGDEVTVEWKILYKKELYVLYSLPNTTGVIKSRLLRWAGNAASMRKRKGAYRVLVEKPEGRRLLGRSRHRWENNIKICL